METPENKYSDITDKILKAFFNVYNNLGYGFLDNVYEKAMIIELRKQELFAERQKPVTIYYESFKIGDYNADIIVEKKVIIEIKAVDTIAHEHEMQLINYLKATQIEVGLLLNFGTTPQHQIKVLTNTYKNHNIS